jgi:hypothetical protein
LKENFISQKDQIFLKGDFCVKNLLNVSFALFLTTLTACDHFDMSGSSTDRSPQPGGEPKTRIRSLELANNIKVAITGADPEKYTVQFSWPYLETGKTFRIRLGNVLSEVQPDQSFFTHTVDHNQTLNYSFDILDSSRKVEVTFRKTVIIPYDFVVTKSNNPFSNSQKIEANRVFLSEESPLTLNDQNLEIVTNELHSEKGFIQTFPEKVLHTKTTDGVQTSSEDPPTAADQTAGKAGGNIKINAKKLFGRLKVFMRGEKGGIGAKGKSIENRKAGFGAPAGVGSTECADPDPCRSHADACLKNHKQKLKILRVECWCDSFGAQGGLGIKGDKGNPGEPGKMGGDTGNAQISIAEYVPLEGIDSTMPGDRGEIVEIIQIPGPGGNGGPGGDGQKGSLGGLGRDLKLPVDCRGPNGGEGPVGDLGAEGPKGTSGSMGKKCIYVGSEAINECTQ